MEISLWLRPWCKSYSGRCPPYGRIHTPAQAWQQIVRRSARNCEYSAFLSSILTEKSVRQWTRPAALHRSTPPSKRSHSRRPRGRLSPSPFVTAISALCAPPFSSRGGQATTRPRRRSRQCRRKLAWRVAECLVAHPPGKPSSHNLCKSAKIKARTA